jgi:hypothetical protein
MYSKLPIPLHEYGMGCAGCMRKKLLQKFNTELKELKEHVFVYVLARYLIELHKNGNSTQGISLEIQTVLMVD